MIYWIVTALISIVSGFVGWKFGCWERQDYRRALRSLHRTVQVLENELEFGNPKTQISAIAALGMLFVLAASDAKAVPLTEYDVVPSNTPDFCGGGACGTIDVTEIPGGLHFQLNLNSGIGIRDWFFSITNNADAVFSNPQPAEWILHSANAFYPNASSFGFGNFDGAITCNVTFNQPCFTPVDVDLLGTGVALQENSAGIVFAALLNRDGVDAFVGSALHVMSDPPPNPTPLPSAIFLLGSVLAGLGGWFKFRGRNREAVA